MSEIPGNGEEELAGLYGVEEIAEAGREEEGWHRVDQVHAEHRQTIRPDRQTVGQYRQTAGPGRQTVGQYRQTVRPMDCRTGQLEIRPWPERQMFKPGKQKFRPSRHTDGQAGKKNMRPNRLKREKESRNRNPHPVFGTTLRITVCNKCFQRSKHKLNFHFSL